MSGSRCGIQRRRRTVTGRRTIFHLAVGCFIRRPLYCRARRCNRRCGDSANDRRRDVVGRECRVGTHGEVTGGILRLHAIVVSCAAGQSVQGDGVSGLQCRIQRCR